MSTIGTLQCVVLDCPDPRALARFYATVLGGEVNRPDGRWALDESWATLHLDAGSVLCFQEMADYRPPTWPEPSRPQQLHLDVEVPDLDEAERAVLEAGATLLDTGTPGQSWRVYADPAGHPFCLVRHA
ncbi:VOC family protein [Nonomuraea sp. NPDC050328]|uniref:VOC family protein n=1 Tax=Nonomuraea sp. NPDC050328 TaxID=3364361 RepID=UPI0037A4D46A